MATPKDAAGANEGEVGVSVEGQSVAQVRQHQVQASSGIRFTRRICQYPDWAIKHLPLLRNESSFPQKAAN